MVLEHYKLQEQPFGVTPDSRYLFLSATHREALASLLYGIESARGFVALIATPGLGKTTLLFKALTQLQAHNKTVFLFQTICTPEELLQALLRDLGILDVPATLVAMQLRLNELLIEQSRLGKRLVVVIDEAQNLSDSVLELVRMLSNFETQHDKLIQIILSGQPQLADKLLSPEFIQLRQRISIFAHLDAFSPAETALYINHRLRMAGYNGDVPLFTEDASAMIAQISQGIPRNINNLCFNALSLGCALKRNTIDRYIVREVVADLDSEPLHRRQAVLSEPPDQSNCEVPTFRAGYGALPSIFTKWFPTVAVALALLLIAGWLGFGRVRTASERTAVVASAPPSHVPVSPLPSSANHAPQPAEPTVAVRVTPKQTLTHICIEQFGSCSQQLLHEIQGFNPRLTNLNHIESGQVIRIPVDTPSTITTVAANQLARTSATEKGMQ